MKLYYEWGIKQLRKHGEELCGDSIAVSRHADSVTLALSDGLGSGVKASILATLTTQIALFQLHLRAQSSKGIHNIDIHMFRIRSPGILYITECLLAFSSDLAD